MNDTAVESLKTRTILMNDSAVKGLLNRVSAEMPRRVDYHPYPQITGWLKRDATLLFNIIG